MMTPDGSLRLANRRTDFDRVAQLVAFYADGNRRALNRAVAYGHGNGYRDTRAAARAAVVRFHGGSVSGGLRPGLSRSALRLAGARRAAALRAAGGVAPSPLRVML